MLSALRRRLTYANVAASLALFIALGGSAFAASSFISKSGSITGCVDKSGAVRIVAAGKKCGKGEKSLKWSQKGPTGKTGKNGKNGNTGAQGLRGLTGPPGSAGTPGSPGQPGENGATNLTVREGPDTADFSSVTCFPGERATGGGGITDGLLSDSTPGEVSGTPVSWEAAAENANGTSASVQAWVVCAAP
jgi:Collagen triple helix repeat (20 copies)